MNNMDDIIEISDMDLNANDGWGGKSTNFGGGLELLMNDKIKDSSRSASDINLDELNNLENELNDLVDDIPNSSFAPKSDFFNRPSVSFEEPSASSSSGLFGGDSGSGPSISLGHSTSQTENEAKTWDGYGKFNNIPLNPDRHMSEPKLSREEMLKEKFKYLRKLEALEKKGVELSKKYNMESSLQEMMGEYETIMEEKTKQNSVKFQGNMLMAFINGIEFLNGKFNPFDVQLDGWSEQINENLGDYDDVFGELYEKYKSKASMAPELKLLFQLGGSAMMVHLTNTMFKSAMPGMDDILRQNPDLMRSFQTAAVNSMSQNTPNFANFVGGVMNDSGRMGPPPPMATQGPNAIPPPVGRPGNNNYSARPDLNFSKSNFMENDGISLRENFERPDFQDRTSKRQPRPEMKGPSDISDILSGLKTKTINIQEPQQSKQQTQLNDNNNNDSSTISLNDLKELQSEGNMPKRSGRRKKSSSNTVSLDI